ncbi:nucleotidyltransferase family protein [Pseudarthrobacter sp. L1SW]|uniref:nucleotidyltransferase family protein n=1 Tax=Pseudarthrobacter sp. L1SW TaxID=2851598 RepID=UPI001E60E9B6|nr:nucleotidyltransferase family protein [Pseudarthrobacter sp. L1SW]UEL27794.1 nucleotidyltransferase family protein [Pseudarthrobacter sp. L1SW]
MADNGSATQLSISEAVLLGHTLVARVADCLDIRAFFIKGPASVAQGLRQPKTSADVDVYVEPSSVERMLQGLRERGWRERPVDPDSRTFPKHSFTLDHPEWPCCIDVHFRFPGMEMAAEECFEVMWASTETLELAGQQVRVPSKALGILILALHALRSPQLPACRKELEFLADITKRYSHAPAIFEIATATGSLAAMRTFLEDLLPDTTVPEWPEPSMEWRNRLMAREPGSARLVAIVRAPWREKPGMLWRAMFPPPEVLLSQNIYADMSLRGQLAQYRARWARFLRSAPRLVRDLRGLR